MLQRAYSGYKDLTLSPYVTRFLLERLNKGSRQSILDPLYSSPFFWVKEYWDR